MKKQCVVLENHPNDSRVKIREDNTFQTLSSRMGTGGGNVPMVLNKGDDEMEESNAVVRRLTPTECSRLQNFPDGWCDIGEWIDSKGKKHKDADAPKYKALGNSIALPFWQFLANNMVKELKEDGVDNPTICSLFSGIGGFELVFERAGAKCLASSEIEEYPIAVLKKHFGDEETGEKGDIEKYI